MAKNQIKFEDKSTDWNIWKKTSSSERSIQRVKNKIPEMECSKQLGKIVKNFYRQGDKVLDFGCAAGHYYYSLKKIDKNISYYGFDSTHHYINFAKKFFKKNKNMKFDVQNIFSLSKKYYKKFDIVFCCNVLLHLPSIDLPLKSLLSATKKYCIIRTLVSDQTHLSKFYYNDETDKKGVLNNFKYQNTYSYNLIKKKIKQIGNYKINFESDYFNGSKINKEYKKDYAKYPGLTKFINNFQIAGGKVFEFKWIIIKK